MKKVLLSAAALAAGISGVAALPAGGAVIPGCTSKTNIEAIIDDSGSMDTTDNNRLRVHGMELFIDRQGNESKTLGAVEFGTDASSLFTPRTIGGNQAFMKGTLAQVQADSGSTNYNAAFNLANSENPSAQARIFLTDGGHNAGDYENGHLGGGKPPTYVIGLGDLGGTQEDVDRLQKIADETGGRYYRDTQASDLQARFNEISQGFDCQTAPVTKKLQFTQQGQSKPVATNASSADKSIDIVTTWSKGTFTVGSLQLVRGGKVVGAAKVKKLKVSKKTGATFVSLRVTKPGKGKLKLKVKAKTLDPSASFDPSAGKVTVQISKNR